jgi:peptidoglycan/LPS O-acetylase OafA/YrhL
MSTQIQHFLFPKLNIQYTGSKEHILALDGLRGLAILLVILFHMFHFMFGWCGVDLFFVLSGFLITGVLLESKDTPHYFSNFWIKRILRIFPLYYLVLAVILIPKIYFKINTVSFTSWTYWAYLQNWGYVIKGVFPDGKDTLNHFWSLAIEEQFYLFFPFIIRYLKNKWLPYLFLGFVVLAVISRFYFYECENIGYYVATSSRLDSLSIGALLAYGIRYRRALLQKWSIPVFYISLLYVLGVLIVTQDPHFSNPYFAKFGLTVIALLFGSTLILSIASPKKSFVPQLFTHKILTFLGKISYGLYVYHWILYVFIKPPLENLIFGNLQHVALAKILTSLTILAIAIFTSYFSFLYIEKRFLRLKKRWVYGYNGTPSPIAVNQG